MKLIPLIWSHAKINQPKANLISTFHNIWDFILFSLDNHYIWIGQLFIQKLVIIYNETDERMQCAT